MEEKVIHEGIDTRGQWYKLVHDPETGGCKYIFEKGHVWAGYEVKNLRIR
tara:strand:+ start:350 stop:499 length:150 start_codon:yes stop_codon:yes gene_type:complete